MTSYRDWVVELSNTTGTGAYALAGAPAGTSYFTFRQRYSDGETNVVYWVVNADRTKWEKNSIATLTYGTPDSLARNVVESTNGDAAVSWIGGDLPLRLYVVPDATAQQGGITQWLAASRNALFRFGMWWKSATPSSGFDQLNVFDGTSDDPAGLMNTVSHRVTLYGMGRGHLGGLTLSRSSTTVLGIAAGECIDSTNVAGIYLASAFTKSTAGAWASGSGSNGMGTGLTIANSTWYHVFAILKAGLNDVYFDTSISAANKPSGTTHFRRLGSFLTDGSAQIIAFIQDGDLFQWVTPVKDINSGNPGTSAVTRTLASVPTGVRVQARLQVITFQGDTAINVVGYLSDLSTADILPTFSGTAGFSDTTLAESGGVGAQQAASRVDVFTNTSAQIRSRIAGSNANTSLTINTLGWIDRRGRDS